jgi:hypothetical protein
MAAGPCNLGSWRRWWCGSGCTGRGVEVGAPTDDLVQHVDWLDPVGRHGEGLAAHKDLQRFLSPRGDLVGAAVSRLQGPACCVLSDREEKSSHKFQIGA